MTRRKLQQWLSSRWGGVPPALRSSIEGALAADLLEPVAEPADALRCAADRLIAEVVSGAPKDPALLLLTADALITYACEALSEQDPRALADVT